MLLVPVAGAHPGLTVYGCELPLYCVSCLCTAIGKQTLLFPQSSWILFASN